MFRAMTLRIESFSGADARRYIPELARLRIEIFRDFPYLYDGSEEYERKYLSTYTESPDSVIAVAFDGERAVGASTALPLKHETPNIVNAFRKRGDDIDKIFYFGESVLAKAYRGQGAGVKFFEHREAWAKKLGYAQAAFCAVVRPPDHPRRPKNYVPLDAFWRRRGYALVPGLECEFAWKDLDEPAQSPKRMTFWMKAL
jgi:GNAT superfamily N-acetyltransferase